MAVPEREWAQGIAALDQARSSILVVASKWWPLSARLAASLVRHGWQVTALCPTEHPLTRVSGVRKFYRYPGIAPLASLRRALLDGAPDLIVPCDDGVVGQLHVLHGLDPSLRSLIERSLGSPDSYPIVEQRYRFLNLAGELGVRVPLTRKVTGAGDVVEWHKHAKSGVLKVDGESGGNGVRISHSLEESLAAWRRFSTPSSLATACKRLVIDRDPLALWSRQRQTDREVTLQEFIPGRPANSMMFCWEGELVSIVSVVVVAAEGATGASTIVRVIDDERMQSAGELVAARLKLSGFYGLDFIIDSDTGVPYLIEMNPRCTQLGHLELAGKESSLVSALSQVWRGGTWVKKQNASMSGKTIALFPQALAAGQACRAYVEASFHDVPTDEPALMNELMMKSWPQRQWPARIYHAFKPLDRADPMLFEALGAGNEPVPRAPALRKYMDIDQESGSSVMIAATEIGVRRP